MSRNNLANILESQGKYEEAEAEYRAALALLETALGPDHPHVAVSRSNLAALLLDQDRFEEALSLAEQAWLRWQQGDVPPGETAETAFVLARALWAAHPPGPERTRARALAEDALQSYEAAGENQTANAEGVRHWLEEHPLR